MEFEMELRRLATGYTEQGYDVVIDPAPDDLPAFAKSFRLQLCCRRGSGGVLVAAFPNREAMSSDPRTSEYAEKTAPQPDWRLDLAILGAVPTRRNFAIGNAHEPSVEQLGQAADQAERAAGLGFESAAFLAAWGLMEAAGRVWLRATDRYLVNPQTPWHDMADDLYSEAALSTDEYEQLAVFARWRNQVAHGFLQPELHESAVRFVAGLTRRLVSEATNLPAAATAAT